MKGMTDVMRDLYASEINCGIESFWDGGFTAWIGDDSNGIKAERGFDAQELDLVGPWLLAAAKRIYAQYQTRES